MHKELTAKETDALKEISSIGAGHAATALSQIIGKTVTLKVPTVKAVPFKDVPNIVGGSEAPVIGLYLRIYGDTKGSVLMVFPQDSVSVLLKYLLGAEPDAERFYKKLQLEPMEESVLKEIGNILTGCYLTTLSKILNINLISSVPGFSYDMAGAVLDCILIKLSDVAETALLVVTEFMEPEKTVQGHFFLIPDPQSLDIILNAMGNVKW